MFKKAPPAPPMTRAQKIEQFQRLAASELAKSAKAGRLEALNLHAQRATAFATLAVSYLLSPAEVEPEAADEPVEVEA